MHEPWRVCCARPPDTEELFSATLRTHFAANIYASSRPSKFSVVKSLASRGRRTRTRKKKSKRRPGGHALLHQPTRPPRKSRWQFANHATKLLPTASHKSPLHSTTGRVIFHHLCGGLPPRQGPKPHGVSVSTQQANESTTGSVIKLWAVQALPLLGLSTAMQYL